MSDIISLPPTFGDNPDVSTHALREKFLVRACLLNDDDNFSINTKATRDASGQESGFDRLTSGIHTHLTSCDTASKMPLFEGWEATKDRGTADLEHSSWDMAMETC